jgi:hypothetical protein
MSSIIKVDTIQTAAGTEVMSFDSNGVVTRPTIPAWRLTGIHQDITSSGAHLAKWEGQDDAVSADNRRFVLGGCSLNAATTHITVPKTGLYQVNAIIRIDEMGSSFTIARLRVNDSLTNDSFAIFGDGASTDYDSLSVSDVLYLRANDTVSVDVYSHADTSWEIDAGSNFSGIFIG